MVIKKIFVNTIRKLLETKTMLKSKFYKKICDEFRLFLTKINELLENQIIPYSDRFKIYKAAQGYISRFKQTISYPCFQRYKCADFIDQNPSKYPKTGTPFNELKSISPAEQSKYPIIYPFEITNIFESSDVKYLQPIDNQKIQDLPKDEQDRIVKLNDDKFLKASVDFLNKLKTISDEINLSDINVEEMTNLVDATTIGPIDESYKLKVRLPTVAVRETAEELKQPIRKQSSKRILEYEDQESNKKPKSDDNESDDDMFGGSNNSDIINNYYTNTYKCNVGNYLKSFIPIINKINNLLIIYSKKPSLNLDYSKTLAIKVLLSYIDFINDSYTPKLNSNLIVKSINKIDQTFTIEQMNTILNMYSKQLSTYMVINDIITNKDMSSIDLVNLLVDTIDYNTYNSLDMPFSFLLLKNTIISKGINIQSEEVEQQPSIQTNVLTSSIQPSQKREFQDIEDDSELQDYKRRTFFEIPSYTPIKAFGGISSKNRKKNKNLITKNNRIKSKKHTIKKRKNKKNNKTRRN